MKKLIVLLLMVALFSCNQHQSDQTIISGKFINTKEGKFTLRGNSFSKEINVGADGSFSDTLTLPYNGAYEIGRQELFLLNGKSLTINANAEEPDAMKFEGDLAVENNYIAQRNRYLSDIMQNNPRAFYSLPETEFVANVAEMAQLQEKSLESTNFTGSDFKQIETQNLSYLKESLYRTYTLYHGKISGDSLFKVSDNFPKSNDNIDLDNAKDFDNSTAYRALVQLHFNKKIEEEMGKEYNEEKYNAASLNIFKNIKSQNIKNSFAKNLSYSISPSNAQAETLYNEIMASVTDETLKKDLTEQFNKIKNLVKGKPSPKFNYENYKGGNTSLDDFKGKFVYVDVWATWCGPCKAEIPYLKEIEHKYKGKNIEIVSISIDAKKDYETWKNFVKDNNLGGNQLFADKDWKSQFVVDYGIQGIPRFILIDTEGNIISADAPRPSDPKLITLLTELGI